MWKSAVLVFIGACSFGILSSFAKVAYNQGFTVGQVTGAQVLFGTCFLWLFAVLANVFGFLKGGKGKREPRWQLLLAGLSSGSVSILYYQCVQMVPASIAVILLMQFVWISIVVEAVLFKIKPTRLQIMSVFLVLSGTVLAAGVLEKQEYILSVEGVLYGFAAALGYAVFVIVNGRLGNNYPAVQKSALMLTGASVLVIIVFPPTFLFDGALSAGLWRYGLLLAVFGAVLPPLLYAIGIPKVGVNLSAILSAAELPVAVGMSYLLLSEKVSFLQWLGVAVILLAIVLPNYWKMKHRNE